MEEHNHTSDIQLALILLTHCNLRISHSVPSAASSCSRSLLFRAHGEGCCLGLSVVAYDVGSLLPLWKVFISIFNQACTSSCSLIMFRRQPVAIEYQSTSGQLFVPITLASFPGTVHNHLHKVHLLYNHLLQMS